MLPLSRAPAAQHGSRVRRKARNPRVELRVGKPAVTGEVDGRDLVRRTAAEMRDPVVMANGQGFLLMSRGSLRRLIAVFILCDICRMERPNWGIVLR